MQLNLRGIAVTAIAMASTGWLGPEVPNLIHALGGSDFTTALGALLALSHLLICIGTLVAVALGLSGRLSTGGAIAGLLFVGAVAAPAAASVDGLQLPDRPAVAVPPPADVVVQPGDSLWAIAGRSGTSDVPAAVSEWYRTNQKVIGSNPDLILPGQRLRAPE